MVFLLNTSEHFGGGRRITLKKPNRSEYYSDYSMQSTATPVGKQEAIYNFFFMVAASLQPSASYCNYVIGRVGELR